MIKPISASMRGTDRTASMTPGEVIVGNVLNGIENRRASGKLRPVIVVDASATGHLIVVGLTSKEMTQKGERRVEIVDNADWKWRGRSFIFGWRLTHLSRFDVGDRIGWLSARDAATLSRVFGFESNWIVNSERAVA